MLTDGKQNRYEDEKMTLGLLYYMLRILVLFYRQKLVKAAALLIITKDVTDAGKWTNIGKPVITGNPLGKFAILSQPDCKESMSMKQ